MKSPPFLTISGHPILDFVNTYVQHSDYIEDRIKTVTTAKAFFKEIFKSNYKMTQNEHVLLLSRRQGLRNLFTKLIKRKSKIELLSDWPLNQKVPVRLILTEGINSISKKDGVQLQILEHSFSDTILFNYALDFLSAFESHRIKKCKSPTCNHLFYDLSKSNTRVWCTMKSCGNLSKVRNFRKHQSR